MLEMLAQLKNTIERTGSIRVTKIKSNTALLGEIRTALASAEASNDQVQKLLAYEFVGMELVDSPNEKGLVMK